MQRVLLIDDHAGIRQALRGLLQARGFEVVAEAGCAATALAAAARFEPDAALLDVNLGADDGYRVCRALALAMPRIAVVLTSAKPTPHAPRLARLVGARGFVDKARLHSADLHALFKDPIGG